MTERARLVYALLRTAFAWAETLAPRSGSGLDRVPRGFQPAALRYVTCPDCLANSRPEGMPGCETCGGRGEIPDPRKDPMDDPIKNPPADSRRINVFRDFGGTTTQSDRDQAHHVDLLIARLEADRITREGCGDCPGCKAGGACQRAGTSDPLTRALGERDRQYRQGSYPELVRVLWTLSDEYRHLAWTVAYQPFGEAPIDPIKGAVVALCEVIALLMDGPIRVPDFVPVSADAELERLARSGKGALWRGRGDWHNMKRHERDVLIAAMAADGRPPGEIGLRFNLTRKRVQQIVAEQHAASAGTVSGGAA